MARTRKQILCSQPFPYGQKKVRKKPEKPQDFRSLLEDYRATRPEIGYWEFEQFYRLCRAASKVFDPHKFEFRRIRQGRRDEESEPNRMKRTIVIEVEETIIETRVVVPGDIHCPACGTVVSMTGPQKEVSPLTRHPLIETISIAPTNIKALGPAEDQQVVGKE